jgi:RNA polymerase sigma-70 factor (ECF subfamily)
LGILRNVALGATWNWSELRESAVGAAAGVLSSRQDAEDAAQEALVRAWRARQSCADQGRPGAWVAQIARNEALRLGSRISRRGGLEVVPPEGIGEIGGQCAELARAAAETSFSAQVAGLPARDRELLQLRYVEDLEYTAIAERLDIPLGTVKVRLHRLRTRLREGTK